MIQQHHRTIEQADSETLMRRSQGALAVLRNLKSLRNSVNGSER
jgi:hypothetical protein